MTTTLKALVLAAALVATAAACGGGDPATVDAAALEDEIVEQLDDEGIDAEVECPEDREAEEGDEFTCDATAEPDLEFEVDVVQTDDEGSVTFEVAALIFDRTEIEEAIVAGLDEQIEEDFLADCSTEVEEVFIAEDGDTFICGLGGIDSGTGAAVEVTIDEDADDGFTFEIIEGSGTEAEPSEDEDEQAGGGGEVVIAETFDDDTNGWGEFDEIGFVTELADTGTLRWDADPGTESLPFEQFPDALLPVADELTDVEVGVDLLFGFGGVAGLTCLSSPDGTGGGYALVVSSTRAAIHRMEPGGGFTEIAGSDPGVVDITPAEDIVRLRAACIANGDGTTSLSLTLDGETVVEAEDDDGFESGIAGVLGAFDADVPQDQREVLTIVYDNFEVVAF